MRALKSVFAPALIALLCAPAQSIAQIDDDCTHSQGFWKTHSDYGPAPYDDTWALLPLGADTNFFLSGQSWYDVAHTPPRRNAYYILAGNFEAAILNILAGASAPAEVLNALSTAISLYNTCTPGQVANGVCDRKEFLSINSTLGSYNEGEIGPGACVECPCFDGIETGEPYYEAAKSAIATCEEPYQDNFQTDTDYSFFFEEAEPPFVVNIGRVQICDGTVTASCFGGPAGTFNLTQEQFDLCIQGPEWPALTPD